jgi:hypothetical protein
MRLRYDGNDNVGVVPLVFAAVAGAVVLVVLIVAYRRHRVAASIAARSSADAQLERDREYNERFSAAAAQVGDDKAAIQLAGVRAMAELADDWPEHRQTCVDALCASLRRLNSQDAGLGAAPGNQPKSGSTREVRRTAIETDWSTSSVRSSPVVRSVSTAPGSPPRSAFCSPSFLAGRLTSARLRTGHISRSSTGMAGDRLG